MGTFFLLYVSTHSRPKAAGGVIMGQDFGQPEFQHTAARRRLGELRWRNRSFVWFQHTAARRRLDCIWARDSLSLLFQHTAARRRLVVKFMADLNRYKVSTHSRPKAAGRCWGGGTFGGVVSTHSRPKAAGSSRAWFGLYSPLFQHTAARRRLVCSWLQGGR